MSSGSFDTLALSAEAGSARQARRFVRRRLEEWGCEDLIDVAVLCVSELVTNAVVHTHTPLSLDLWWTPPRLRVALHDHSPSPAIGARTLAAVGGNLGAEDGDAGDGSDPEAQATSGRGLLIVAGLAATVGETIEADGKVVWFDLIAGRATDTGPAVIVRQDALAPDRPAPGRAGEAGGDSGDDAGDGGTGTAGGGTGTAGGGPAPAATPTVRLVDVPVGLAVANDDHLSDLVRELTLSPGSSLAERLLAAVAETGGCFPFDGDAREALRAARVFGKPRLDIELRVDAGRLAALRRLAGLLEEADELMRAGRLLTLPAPAPVGRFRHWALEEIAAQLAGAPPAPPPEILAAPGRHVQPGDRPAPASEPEVFLDLSDPVQMIARLRKERAVIDTLQRVGKAVTARLTLPEVVQVATEAAIGVTPAAFGAFEPGFRGETTRMVADRASELGGAPVRSLLAVPVVLGAGEVVGGLVLGHPEPGRFGPEDARLVEGIAGYMAIAMENARLYEAAQRELEARRKLLEERAELTTTLQASLLPPELPVIPELAVAARYRPGAADVGGDFYDVFPLRGRNWGFILGDVCGKGPAAAAKTALARYTLRTAAMLENRAPSVLQVLNDALLEQSEAESFCSALFARLRPGGLGATGELAVSGHPRPLLRRATGEIVRLGSGGRLLGIVEGPMVARRVPLSLSPGDVLVFYTDGVTEARRGVELFGDERLADTVSGAGPTAEDVVSAIEDAVTTFGDDHHTDDVALLAVSPTGGG